LRSDDNSQYKMENMYTDLFALIVYDDDLRPVFVEASESKELSADDLNTTLRRLLKKFGQDLRSEAFSEAQKRATCFISLRARILARDIVNTYWSSGESEKESPRISHIDQDDTSSASGGDGEDIGISEQPASFESMKAFILSSTAFPKLISRIHRYVDESLISWDTVTKQWEEELQTFVPSDLPGNPTIRVLDSDNCSLFDLVKLALERYSGEEWLWRPFARPRRKLADGRLRVVWRCVSGPFLFPS
jgi:hypothetical protein